MTNSEFAKKDTAFISLCESIGLPMRKHSHMGLSRQAAKFRRGKGLAYKAGILKMDVSTHLEKRR